MPSTEKDENTPLLSALAADGLTQNASVIFFISSSNLVVLSFVSNVSPFISAVSCLIFVASSCMEISYPLPL